MPKITIRSAPTVAITALSMCSKIMRMRAATNIPRAMNMVSEKSEIRSEKWWSFASQNGYFSFSNTLATNLTFAPVAPLGQQGLPSSVQAVPPMSRWARGVFLTNSLRNAPPMMTPALTPFV